MNVAVRVASTSLQLALQLEVASDDLKGHSDSTCLLFTIPGFFIYCLLPQRVGFCFSGFICSEELILSTLQLHLLTGHL